MTFEQWTKLISSIKSISSKENTIPIIKGVETCKCNGKGTMVKPVDGYYRVLPCVCKG